MAIRIEEFRIPLDNGRSLFAKEVVAELEDCDANSYVVIVVHGGPGLNSHEESFTGLKKLMTATGGAVVRAMLFYDQLGCGSSDVPPMSDDLYSLDYFTQELQQVIEASKQRHPRCFIGLLGHSWGGQIVLELLLKYNVEPCCQCAIISNSPLNEQTYAQRRLELFQALDESVRTFLQQDEEEQQSSGSVSFAIYQKLIGKNELTITGEMADWDALQRMDRLACPCLFVTGTNDTIPYQEYEKLSTLHYPLLPQPPKVFLQEKGEHGPFYGETANEYFHQILKFLNENT